MRPAWRRGAANHWLWRIEWELGLTDAKRALSKAMALPLLKYSSHFASSSLFSPLKTRPPHLSCTQTLARASTLAAVATAASAVQGAVIVFNTPITSNNINAGATGWNIDGIGGVEANIVNVVSFFSYTSTAFTLRYKNIASAGAGFKVVVHGGSKLKGLAANALINASRAFSPNVGGVFFSDSYRGMIGEFGNAVSFISGASSFMGFQFKPGSTVLYGWANVTLTRGGNFGTFTINSWAYDDTGASILTGQTVAAVPEPASYAVGLGALALGAAALRRRRQARAIAA
jgi:hypothetical protein